MRLEESPKLNTSFGLHTVTSFLLLQQLIMIKRHFTLTDQAAAPLTFFQRDRSNDLAKHRKKTHSITPVKHLSPNRVLENPQERRRKDPYEEIKWSVRGLKSQTTFIKPPDSLINFKENEKKSIMASHHLSVHNLRTTFSPLPFVRKQRPPLNKSRDLAKPANIPNDNSFFDKKQAKKLAKPQEKKCKMAPSFLKNKNNQNTPTMDDFKILKTLKEQEQYRQMVALHKKTQSVFVIKGYKKAALSKQKQLCEQIKFYIKNIEINHNLIVKCFGFFYDTEFLYLIEEFLAGEIMAEFMAERKQPLNQQEIGSKVCQVLTAITYLNSIHFSYGNINQNNIVNSLNICKLKRPYLIYQKKDMLFDIWCLGKLAFEMITCCKLVEERILEGCHQIKDLFNSNEIVMALQVGFKRFQGSSLSRDLIKFLITTLWEIQSQDLTLEQVWDLDFIKLYKEDDVWQGPKEK